MRGMRRMNRKTTYNRAREILHAAPYGVLCTTCDDGMPYGIPLSFVLTGYSIYFHCAVEGQKLDNIAYDARVCLTAVSHAQSMGKKLTMAYESAIAFGTAHVVHSEDERQAALKALAEKYAPELEMEKLEAHIKKWGADTIIVRMDVEYMTGKEYHPEISAKVSAEE